MDTLPCDPEFELDDDDNALWDEGILGCDDRFVGVVEDEEDLSGDYCPNEFKELDFND